MKESNEWVRQQMVDEAADKVLQQRGCDVTEIKPYWVAAELNCNPNGALSAKVYDWRKRRLAERAVQTIEVPPEAEAEFRSILDRVAEDAMGGFLRTVRTVGSDIDRSATLRIADAERRRDQAEAELMDLVQLCQKAEEQVLTLEKRASELEEQLQDLRGREQRLLGRLEQQEANARPVGHQPAAAASPEPIGTDDNGPPSSSAVTQAPVDSAEPVSAAAEMLRYVQNYGDDAKD